MLLPYKPLHLEAQQRLQEEGCVVDMSDHVRKNTKNISFGAVHRCSFEHYTCHRNLGKLRKIELRCDYRLLIGKKFHLDE